MLNILIFIRVLLGFLLSLLRISSFVILFIHCVSLVSVNNDRHKAFRFLLSVLAGCVDFVYAAAGHGALAGAGTSGPTTARRATAAETG